MTVSDRIRPLLSLLGHEVRPAATNGGYGRAGHLHVGMRCSTTARHLMGTFRATPEAIALVRTSVLSGPLTGEIARTARGAYRVSADYPGCAACGALSYFQCGGCGTVSCWRATPTGWCAACGTNAVISGRITTIAVADGG